MPDGLQKNKQKKHKQSTEFSSLWSDGGAGDQRASATLTGVNCSYSSLGSAIHNKQVNSILILVYKVYALHFFTLRLHPCLTTSTHIRKQQFGFGCFFPPSSPSQVEVTKLSSGFFSCRLMSTAMTPAPPVSSARLQSSDEERGKEFTAVRITLCIVNEIVWRTGHTIHRYSHVESTHESQPTFCLRFREKYI